MSAHTPGRLTYQEDSDAYTHILRDADGRFIASAPQGTTVQEPNMRRLAACWNACEGMETHDIEALSTLGNVGDMFRSLHQQIGSVKADLMRSDIKLAAARADLEKARLRDEGWHEHTTRKWFELNEERADSQAIEANYEAARALLAEAADVKSGADFRALEQRIRQFLEPK